MIASRAALASFGRGHLTCVTSCDHGLYLANPFVFLYTPLMTQVTDYYRFHFNFTFSKCFCEFSGALR